MKSTHYIERKRHGSLEFPVEYYYVDENHPRYVMASHWHKEFELLRVLRGEFIAHLNNVEYTLHAGDLLLIECGCLHTGQPSSCIYECVVFDLNMLMRQQSDAAEKYIAPIINFQAGVNNFVDRRDRAIHDAVGALFAALVAQTPCYELEVYSLLYHIFAQLYAREYITPCVKTKHTRQAQTLVRLIDWLEQNYAEHITLEMLCALTGFSKKYLCHIFKEYTSKTLMEHINELRIENACFELAEHGKSITAAALDNGFNDSSYFCKLFKRYKGITPKEYQIRSRLQKAGVHPPLQHSLHSD